jgi:hypothetical protein
MKAHSTDTHTHTKWGRMVDTAVETVLRPFRRVFAGTIAGSSVETVIRLDELRPEMLVGESPPTVEVTEQEAERLEELAAHGLRSH